MQDNEVTPSLASASRGEPHFSVSAFSFVFSRGLFLALTNCHIEIKAGGGLVIAAVVVAAPARPIQQEQVIKTSLLTCVAQWLSLVAVRSNQ